MELEDQSVSELVAQSSPSGDRAILTAIVERLQPLVAAVVTRTLRRYSIYDREFVRDLCQDAFLKLLGPKFNLKERARGRSDKEIMGLVAVTVANLVRDELKKRREFTPLEMHEQSHEPDVDTMVLVGEVNTILKNLLTGPTADRDYRIFWFYYRDRMTAREISAIPGMGLTVEGVESVLCRLKADVKEALSRPKGFSSKGAF